MSDSAACGYCPACLNGVPSECRNVRSAASGHRRVRMPLSDGHMDVCLTPGTSPETVEALRQIGEAALALMKSEEEVEHGG